MGNNIFQSRPILTSAQMRRLERQAMDNGLATGAQLMERAGAAVAGEIRLRWPKPARACVMCGPGNNGGDGYVVARHLHQAGWQVRVLGMGDPAPPDAALMKRHWQQLGRIVPLTLETLRAQAAEVCVDAIFGTGLARPVAGGLLDLVHHLGDRGLFAGRLVAIDGPSGMCMDSGQMLGWPRGHHDRAPQARLTVTFDSPRPGHVLASGPELCGELVVADIGLGPLRCPADLGPMAMLGGPSFAAAVAQDPAPGQARALALALALGKRASGHKFSHGHALIVAGGAGQGGAARLSARAALRVGAGLVTLAPPAEAMAEHALPPDALMRRAVDGPQDLAAWLKDQRLTAVLLGPGCGIERAGALLPVLLAAARGCVLDADALTALSRRKKALAGLHPACVLTPHLGEFQRLFPDIAAKLAGPQPPETMRGPLYSKLDAASEAAARAGCTIVLKGPDTVIAGPEGRVFVQASSYDAAVPWLATAGSGDVLAGIIAGLMARGWAAFDAATQGAALHAEAGRSFGPGLIADDLPQQLPAVFRGLGL